MKKILLATTVLVGTAGFAAAEVTLSGDARMGVISNFGAGDLGFTSRARVTFTLSGESDSGLSFGASFRADNAGGAASGTAGSVFVSGSFGKLSMGDVDGAAVAAVGHIDGVGLTGLGDTNESAYLANGGLAGSALGLPAPFDANLTTDPSALYEYSAGSLTVYASVTQPNFTTSTIIPASSIEGDAYAVGAKYSMDGYSFGIGYESLDTSFSTGPLTGFGFLEADHVIASASGSFGGMTIKATYGTADGEILGGTPGAAAVDLTQYGVSATYAMDALSVTAFANNKAIDLGGVAFSDTDAMGLGASYDLGGGATVKGGVVRTQDIAGVSDTAYDLGVAFSF